MYYKITNKDSKVYQALSNLLHKEELSKADNEIALENKIGLTFETYLGEPSQQKFNRLPEYYGFKFLEDSDLIDGRIWTKDKVHPEIYVPNRRTKAGREMREFLNNGLKKSYYGKVFEIIKLKHDRRFTFPFLEKCGDVIILFLGDELEPSDEFAIEITKKEFEQFRAVESESAL